jgi:hypothetical protein
MENYYLSLFLNEEFYELVTQQTNKYASYFQKDKLGLLLEGTNARGNKAYCIGELSYTSFIESSEIVITFKKTLMCALL